MIAFKHQVRQGREGRYLYDSLSLDKVSTASHSDGRVVGPLLVQSIQCGPEEFQILESASTISVDHEQPLSPRVQHAVSHCASFPRVLFPDYDPDFYFRVLLRVFECQVRSAVRRTVVYDQNLSLPFGYGQDVFDCGLEHLGHPFCFVIHGHDDREVHCGRVIDVRKG